MVHAGLAIARVAADEAAEADGGAEIHQRECKSHDIVTSYDGPVRIMKSVELIRMRFFRLGIRETYR